MQLSDLPARLVKAFAESAAAGYVRDVPDASQIGVADGAASFTDGFVPLNATPISAGGVPPDIKDMNGVLKRLSQWAKWVSSGGPVPFDPAYAAAIGGYPLGACVRSRANVNLFWLSTQDANTDDPDTPGGHWAALVPIAASDSEIVAGTNTTDFITPKGLHDQRASAGDLETGTAADKLVTALALAGIRASFAEVVAGTDDAKYISPAVLAALRASGDEVIAGTDDHKYITPAALADAFSANSDHIIFPGGLIMQWGSIRETRSGEGARLISFPIAFQSAVYSVTATCFVPNPGDTNTDMWAHISTRTLNDFYFNYGAASGGNNGYGFDWFAIGR